MITTEKTCFKCGSVKPLTEFYRHKRMADGHLGKCKECTKADVHNYRHGNGRDRVLAYERDRAKLPHRMEAMLQTVKAWELEYPERKTAQSKLRRAIRAGRVNPLPCIICGEKAEAHHPDYDRPLDVVWLCPAHHKQAHALAKKAA